jgi:hypothetical protein
VAGAARDVADVYDEGEVLPADFTEHLHKLAFFPGVVGRIADDGERKTRRCFGLGPACGERQQQQDYGASHNCFSL